MSPTMIELEHAEHRLEDVIEHLSKTSAVADIAGTKADADDASVVMFSVVRERLDDGAYPMLQEIMRSIKEARKLVGT